MNGINEGPIILKQSDKKIKCIYSAAGSWTDYYCLGELILTGNPMKASSWVKSEQPILEMDPSRQVYAPGHNGFTVSPDGKEIWMIYHVSKDSGVGWNRRSKIQKVNFNDQGGIKMRGPLADNTPYAIPSGEVVDRLLFEAEDGALTNAQRSEYKGASGGKGVDFSSSLISGNSAIDFVVDVPGGVYYVYIRYTRKDTYEQERNANNIPAKYIYIKSGSGKRAMFTADICSYGSFVMAGGINLTLSEGENTLTIRGDNDLTVDAIILEREK
jgi:hypothetical protein